MPVEEYCIGVLARDMPADYEKEALNAQAVLIRTEVYRMIQEAVETVHCRKKRQTNSGQKNR